MAIPEWMDDFEAYKRLKPVCKCKQCSCDHHCGHSCDCDTCPDCECEHCTNVVKGNN